jgi:hypothetical protein
VSTPVHCVNESCSRCVHGRYIKAPKDTVSEEQLADQAVQKKHKVNKIRQRSAVICLLQLITAVFAHAAFTDGCIYTVVTAVPMYRRKKRHSARTRARAGRSLCTE